AGSASAPRLRNLVGELDPERSLTGDPRFVLVRMDEGCTRLFRVSEGGLERLLEVPAGKLGRRLVVAAGLDLCHRRVLGDEDDGRDAGLAGRPGHGLSGVAGARRHDSGGELRIRHYRDPRVPPGDLA